MTSKVPSPRSLTQAIRSSATWNAVGSAGLDELPTLESYLARAELDDTQSTAQRAKIVRQDAAALE